MHVKKTKQVSFDENPNSFIGAQLSPENRWIKLAQIIPWSRLEGRNNQTFANPKVGKPAKACRMAIGSLIIKERLKLSDEETVAIILDSPYMQFFIGLNNFTDRAPFDTSTMTYFRKRLTPEILAEINTLIVEASKEDDHHDDNDGRNAGTSDEDKPETNN